MTRMHIGGPWRCFPSRIRRFKSWTLVCGTGLELQFLFERLPGAQVTCIDLSEEMLAILREHYQERARQIEIIRTSYLRWEYPTRRYDYAISVNTMHHLEETEKTKLYAKIRRSLKPGGIYVESDFMVDEATMEQYRASFRRLVQDLPVKESGYYHIDIPFTVDIQKKLLLKAGFGEVKVFYENIRPEGSSGILVARVDSFIKNT